MPEAPPAGERERKLLEVIGGTLIARQKRQEIQVWMKRATRFGDAAKAATSKQEAHAVIANAQSLGRIAYRLRRGAAVK